MADAPSKPAAEADRRSRAFLPPRSLAALIAGLVALAVIAILQYRSLVARSVAAEALAHTRGVQQELDAFIGEVTNAETSQRGFLLTDGVERYLEAYTAATANLPQDLVELRRLVKDDPEQLRRVEILAPLVQQKLDELAETIASQRKGDRAAALSTVMSDRGKNVMDRVRAIVAEMNDVESRRLGLRTTEWESTVTTSAYVVFGGVGVLFVMLLLIGALASRDYRAVGLEAWTRRTQLHLATQIAGENKLDRIGEKMLSVLVRAVDAQVGAVYAVEGDRLRLLAGHALDPDATARSIVFGEGLIGQAAKDMKMQHLRDVPADYLRVASASGRTTAREVMLIPSVIDGATTAVVELGFLHAVPPDEAAGLERVASVLGDALRTARERQRREELLEETQRQAEELAAQQEELRVSNEELEQQTRALQVSQTQLENQQAELEQINSQLEEQTQALSHQRDELVRAGAELQKSNEYKSQFLANMSHELRTPLNSSLILAKLLGDNREGNLSAEQVKFAHTIYSAGNDLLTLINDILDLSKIEAGMLDVRPEPVPVKRLVDELAATFQPVAAQKRLELDFQLAPGAPEAIETDPNRVQQVLKNLLSNALKFTERGGVTLAIEGAPGGRVRFSVRDTGIGIPADQQRLIFEPFRQADGSTARKFGGTGLGLSISRDLTRLLGGELRVDSVAGQGSTFSFDLPRTYEGKVAGVRSTIPPRPRTPTPKVTEPIAIAPLAGAAAPPFPDDRAAIGPASRVLLVIEDDIAFAKVLYDLGHELEFQVIAASTAADGLALARHYHASAIVLDVGLPDRSGLAVLDSLKRDPKTRHVPVHVVSASDHTRTALEMGAVGYALKPIERAHLALAIKHLEEKFTQKLRRVLIVEDDPLLRESTAKLLGGDAVETVTAGSAAEALQYLQSTTFDCMVLDLSLPDRSGLELLADMANKEQYGFPPVIVYTGRSLSNDEVHELERFSRSIIIKGARSPERLLDEVTLFLHQVESELPPERQRMLRDARDREAVFEGRKILIAEDDVRNVFALSSVLEPKGAKLVIARNGREAIAALEREPEIDLVLMDIMMPEMDGLEATRRIRKEPRYAKLPIIALTAKAMADDRQRCLDAGTNDYIAKPLDVDKLLSLARVWIRK
ncbi:MAG TPA: response regulator [Kofleriaceae bacterium]|jgi:signal transduction histidine kinase/CheY-like chemotaxis protein/CHASE3 domain sensor protein